MFSGQLEGAITLGISRVRVRFRPEHSRRVKIRVRNDARNRPDEFERSLAYGLSVWRRVKPNG
jgi:hypothetical protein